MFEVYADSRSPRTKIKYDIKKRYFDGKKLYVGKGTELSFEAYDALSGIEQILISVDSSDFEKYHSPIILDKEKTYAFQYYSVDNVGNVEKVKTKIFNVDLTNPVTELIFEGDKFENNISGRAKLVLKATDNISGISAIYYSLDNKKYRKYTYPVKAVYLQEGKHTIKYYSVDKVGNKENEHEYKFYVDKTPPILVDEILGNSFVVNGKEYSSGRTKLKLTAVDNKSGVKEIKYSINHKHYVLYEKPFYLTSVSGSLSVVSYAIDNVGNKSVATEKSTKNKAAYVDLTGPQIKYKLLGKVFKARDTVFVNKDTKIQLTAYDAESGVKTLSYSLHDGEEIPYSTPFTISEEGVYILNIMATANVDNFNKKTVSLIVDNTGPDIYSRFSILPVGKREIEGKMRDVYLSHVVLFLSATDAKVAIDRIYYSINGGGKKAYTGIIEGLKRGKDYVIDVIAKDKLGNENASQVIFGTDNSGPEVFVRFSLNPVSKQELDGKQVDVYPAHVSLFLSVTNTPTAYDRIYYSINGSKQKIYNGIIDGFKSGSVVNMKIRALDRLGNETSKELMFKIE
jgi:hypothetical protein